MAICKPQRTVIVGSTAAGVIKKILSQSADTDTAWILGK